ncbi:hypothetical protein EFB08_02385 [Rufibacter latericius]|uniref:Uncharacterized protein n=1 Tax=Rufibacter latericius TaxID=2487040 RepID=A0A3M9N0S2_9BACT|nr:hypothetical protein EFB08_02385 [Rufibacter latericius]
MEAWLFSLKLILIILYSLLSSQSIQEPARTKKGVEQMLSYHFGCKMELLILTRNLTCHQFIGSDQYLAAANKVLF